MVDVLISDNGFGRNTYDRMGLYDIKYITFDIIEKLSDNRYDFMHFCAPYNKKYFYFLKQCIDMCDRVKCIVIHNSVDVNELINTQNRIGLPIIYVPHSDIDKIWNWSMIGIMSDRLIVDFEYLMRNVKNKYIPITNYKY